MFLAIDVGNTQSTLGLFDEGGRLVRGWRMSTNATDTFLKMLLEEKAK